MPDKQRIVIGGVDTHRDAHTAAAIDSAGRLLDTASFRRRHRVTSSCWDGCAASAAWSVWAKGLAERSKARSVAWFVPARGGN